jgi:oligopeptide/dipeptide ABC transporter ATP-binding protein
MSALLEVNNLSKTYATRKGAIRAVDDVSFAIGEGQTLALVGESGCGKSTVALALLRLIDHDAGEVYFDNRNIDNMSAADKQLLRQKLTILFQNPYSSLNPKMRVIDIVGEPLKTAFGLRGEVLRQRVVQHLYDVGLGSEHLRRYPHEFSGGQRQRIAIARALALEPSLLILDEPTAALDVSVQAQVLNLLRSLQKKHGLSYLFISHNLATVEYLAGQVLVMYLGRIVEAGPVSEVFGSPRHPYTRALLDSIPSTDPSRRDRLKILAGDVPSPLAVPPGCAFVPRCAYATDRCRGERPALAESQDRVSVSCYHPLAKGKLQ